MKHGSNNRKTKILIMCLVSSLFLTGYTFWSKPKLVNADDPFISLTGSIKSSLGNANSAYEEAKPKQEEKPIEKPTVTPKPTATQKPTQAPVTEIEVTISDEEIKVNEYTYKDIAAFERLVKSSVCADKSFIVVDNVILKKFSGKVLRF